MKFDSPLRYPGGKTALGPFLAETVALNGLANCAYFEPFAGGAGAALWLLRKGIVSEVYINDLDPCVAAFWRAALGEPDRFSDVDPPYWEKGGRLYLNSYTPEHHRELAQYMQRQHALRWVMSYDDAPQVERLYAHAEVHRFSWRYNISEPRNAEEFLIAPRHLQLPSLNPCEGRQPCLV